MAAHATKWIWTHIYLAPKTPDLFLGSAISTKSRKSQKIEAGPRTEVQMLCSFQAHHTGPSLGFRNSWQWGYFGLPQWLRGKESTLQCRSLRKCGSLGSWASFHGPVSHWHFLFGKIASHSILLPMFHWIVYLSNGQELFKIFKDLMFREKRPLKWEGMSGLSSPTFSICSKINWVMERNIAPNHTMV